ncbi:hypothetical protein LTR85_005036 [Meristemomyces frigidus]|nr:hypothetical protein LTR85_005036 [Meristemomyces frigidus]
MLFHYSNRRTSTVSTLSASSSTSSLDETVLKMTLPLAPREDDYNMSEQTRQARLLAKCRRAEKAPWKNARPLSSRV